MEGNHIAGLTGLRRNVTTSRKNVYGCLAAPAHYCLSVDYELQILNECDYVSSLVLRWPGVRCAPSWYESLCKMMRLC